MQVALIQVDLKWESVYENRKHIENLIESINTSIDLIILPEMFTTGFTMNAKKVAEKMDGETVAWMQAIASKKSCIITGSIVVFENANYFNRLIWATPDGHVSHYDKRHSFSLLGEGEVYTSGKKPFNQKINNWNVNAQICYDLRFPAWCRNNDNADIQFFVANWPAKRSHHWKHLLKCRAIENQCYVVGVNRIGHDHNGVYHSGDSSVYDFKGDELLSIADIEQVNVIKLDKSALEAYRNRYPFLNDKDAFNFAL